MTRYHNITLQPHPIYPLLKVPRSSLISKVQIINQLDTRSPKRIWLRASQTRDIRIPHNILRRRQIILWPRGRTSRSAIPTIRIHRANEASPRLRHKASQIEEVLGLALEGIHVLWWVPNTKGVVEDKGDFLEVSNTGVDVVAGWLGVEAEAVGWEAGTCPCFALKTTVGDEGGVTTVGCGVAVECAESSWCRTTIEGGGRRVADVESEVGGSELLG